MMKILTQSAALMLLVFTGSISIADNDTRQLVQLPEMMQQHMMSNMRDHLVAINEIGYIRVSQQAKSPLCLNSSIYCDFAVYRSPSNMDINTLQNNSLGAQPPCG